MCMSIPKEISLHSLVGFPRGNGEQISHSGDWAATQDQPWNLSALVWFITGLDSTAHGCSHPCSPMSQPTWVWLHWAASSQFNWTKFRSLLHSPKCQIGTDGSAVPAGPGTDSPQHFCWMPPHWTQGVGQEVCFHTNCVPTTEEKTVSAVELECPRQFLKCWSTGSPVIKLITAKLVKNLMVKLCL